MGAGGRDAGATLTGGTGGQGGTTPAPLLDAGPDASSELTPPTECILPCVWEVMRQCPTPPTPDQCTIENTPDGAFYCDDNGWLAAPSPRVSRAVYQDGAPCYGYAFLNVFGGVWYRPVYEDGALDWRILARYERNGSFSSAVGIGTCFDEAGNRLPTEYGMNIASGSCDPWWYQMQFDDVDTPSNPATCSVPGTCPRPPGYVTPPASNDAGARDGGNATPADASLPLDAAVDSTDALDANLNAAGD